MLEFIISSLKFFVINNINISFYLVCKYIDKNTPTKDSSRIQIMK